MALSEEGELLAAHAMDSWSPDRAPGDTPTFVQLLGHTDEQAAVALLENDLCAFGAASVDVRLVSEADAPWELRTLREEQQQVLGAAGFGVDVDRSACSGWGRRSRAGWSRSRSGRPPRWRRTSSSVCSPQWATGRSTMG
jgi:hypothetical protein